MNTNDLLYNLQQNNYVWLILAIFAISGVLATIYFGIKSSKKMKLAYIVESKYLITNYKSTYGNIKVLHSNMEVENLTVTKIYLWNDGNTVIDSSDIAPKEPVEIIFDDDINILEHGIISLTDDANNIRITQDNKIIKIHFDYLDKKDGVTIQVLHDGIDNAKICAKGKIKGANNIKRIGSYGFNNLESKEPTSNFLKKIFTKKSMKNLNYIAMSLSAMSLFASSFFDNTHTVVTQQEKDTSMLILRIISVVMIITLIGMYFMVIRDKIPKKLSFANNVDFFGNESEISK